MRQAKELIYEIVNQKRKYDEQCLANRQARETMEQYMFTFLNQRYGLKQLIFDWASSIVAAIKTYSKEDHDVLLFGRILKNHVDEEYWAVTDTYKHTLYGLLKSIYRERLQTKQLLDVNKHVDEVA